MGYLTSGNVIVDAMGSINITGNIIPAVWYRTITKENGKPYLLAIVILADIVYWYRPSEVRDQGNGHILGWKKKFSEDILRQSYQYYADLFGESKKTVKTAMDRLEKLQVIKREFRTVSYGDGLVCNNVMYVELKPDMLYRLTFPEEIPAVDGLDDPCAGASGDKTGGSLPTKPDAPMEILGGRGIPKGTQVSTKPDTGHDKTVSTLPPETDTGLSQNGGTNSDISTNISDGESYPINQSARKTEKAERGKPDDDMIDVMDDASAYMEIIKENIEYEHHMKYGEWGDRGLYQELYEVICEIVCVKRKTVKVNGEDFPYELVKSKFLKLDSTHLEYVIDSMKHTTTKITNIRAYMVTALYNASNTMHHYYQQLVQHDMYGGGWQEKGVLNPEPEGDG
ncbi:MAG: DUF6017 domain-containing protein [Lachnospiraceae bacterium]|nr:DUF6017 domain-containing protein [Lachnospiraceae bacterium]